MADDESTDGGQSSEAESEPLLDGQIITNSVDDESDQDSSDE